MGSAKGSRYDQSVVVYNMICEAEEPKKAFEFFFDNADYIESSEEKEVETYFTAQQLYRYEKEYGDLVDALLNKVIVRKYEKEKFYEELWQSIVVSDVLFDEVDLKIYAIGRIWSDARIPYFCLKDGVKMSTDEFADVLEKNKKLLQEAVFILSCKYEQRTEMSSRLLDLINRCDEEKVKIVVMAKILDYVEKRSVLSILRN